MKRQFFLTLGLSIFILASCATNGAAKHLPAVIINNSKSQEVFLSFISDVLLTNEEVFLSPSEQCKIEFSEKSFDVITVFFPTNKYVGLSMAVMSGDTIYVTYNKLKDNYFFRGSHVKELNIYEQQAESKFSIRSWASPIVYSKNRPFEEFLRDWHTLWTESEQRLATVSLMEDIRPEVKKHFVLEARLRLLQILNLPVNLQVESNASRLIPAFYRDTVFAYEKRMSSKSKIFDSPEIVTAYRRHILLLLEYAGNKLNLVSQYESAKQNYSGIQREWVCYSILKNIFMFNKDVEQLPTLLKDYRSLVGLNNIFYKELQVMTQNDNLAIAKNKALNDELLTVHGKSTTIFDLINEHKGKVIYLDLWASWCGPCIGEMPASITLRETYKNQKFVIVYLSVDEDNDKWLKAISDIVAASPESYRFKMYAQSGLTKKIKMSSVPHYLLIDKNGLIRYSNAPRPSDPTLPKLIDSLL